LTVQDPRRVIAPERDAADEVIRGGLGSIAATTLEGQPSWRRRLLALLAIIGPGIIVMVGDNDAGGITTYAQAGQAYGYSLLWTLPVLVVVLAVAQEMVVRLGAVTGVGHGKLLRERFGTFWAAFSVVDLFLLNFLTLVTEFIGIRYALGFFGVSPVVSVAIMAITLIASVLSGRFERWERFMLVLVGVSLLVFPLMALTPVHLGAAVHGLVVPGVKGGLNSQSTIFIIGIVGTTIAPWQLFFQQSNIIDKRITPRWIRYERADTFIGSVVTNVAAAAVIIAAAAALAGVGESFGSAGAIAQGFARHVGEIAGVLFAIVLAEASLIGAATVTLSTSYALGDLFGVDQSLNAPVREAKGFYASYVALVVLAGGLTLLPSLPLSLVNLAVQVLAGVLLPSALAFLLLLCNDREILGPWVNPPWLNVLATFIVGLLLQLSLVLTVVTIAPSVSVFGLVLGTGALVVVVTLIVAVTQLRSHRSRVRVPREERLRWTMPASALLHRPRFTRGRQVALLALRAYLVVAVVLMVVSFVKLGH
jgi:NRAMP (natural resistance-associated macrophage protein)-like metal ion transporter